MDFEHLPGTGNVVLNLEKSFLNWENRSQIAFYAWVFITRLCWVLELERSGAVIKSPDFQVAPAFELM